MSVELLRVQHLRNLDGVEIKPGSGINLISGANASGKTSLLEAIHMLALARSFRSNRLVSVIQAGQDACQLFARVAMPTGSSIPIGMERRAGGDHQIRMNGRNMQSASELARLLPVQVIAPSNFGLLAANPNARRQFLDWGVFHYDERFYGLWKQLKRVLKQRNSSLKCANIGASILASFEPQMVQISDQMDELRATYITALQPLFFACLEQLAPIPNLSLSYYRGWNKDKDLAQVLVETRERDMLLGYTQRGAQRADLRFTVDGVNAGERLSQGQQKLVTMALRLAQGQLLGQSGQRHCVYLVDDLSAELDVHSRQAVCQQLINLQTQVFITAVDKDEFLQTWPQDTPLSCFTVYQGKVFQEDE